MKKKARYSFDLLQKKTIPKQLLGNPIFLKDLDFEQDKIIPLEELFKNNNIQYQKEIINMFIVFNKQLIEYKLIDKSFNIGKNFGLDKNNNIILSDLGELVSDTDKIIQQQKERVLEKTYITEVIKNPDVKEYFIQQMNNHIAI